MDETKYRAWDKLTKKMCEVLNLNIEHEEVLITDCSSEYYTDLKDVELLQFTGLYDCNDEKIYDKDVIKHAEMDGKPSIVNYENGSYYAEGCESFPEKAWRYECLGSSLENPELLKEE